MTVGKASAIGKSWIPRCSNLQSAKGGFASLTRDLRAACRLQTCSKSVLLHKDPARCSTPGGAPLTLQMGLHGTRCGGRYARLSLRVVLLFVNIAADFIEVLVQVLALGRRQFSVRLVSALLRPHSSLFALETHGLATGQLA